MKRVLHKVNVPGCYQSRNIDFVEDLYCAAFTSTLFQLRKQIAENWITFNVMNVANEMSAMINTPGDLVGEDGTVDKMTRRPAFIEQIGNGGAIPNHLRPPTMVLMIAFNDFD